MLSDEPEHAFEIGMPALGENHAALRIEREYGSSIDRHYRIFRSKRFGRLRTGIGQNRKSQTEFLAPCAVGFDRRGIDCQRPRPGRPEFVEPVIQTGQLIPSPRGVVFRIKNDNRKLSGQITQPHPVARRGLQIKSRSLLKLKSLLQDKELFMAQ